MVTPENPITLEAEMKLTCPNCGDGIPYEHSKAGQAVVCAGCTRQLKMPMFDELPTFANVGVPESVPVLESKLAQVGLFEILKVSASPSGSDALGVNQ